MIEVVGVTKNFKEMKVLDNVTMTFKEGNIYGLVGRNGSGKTVLMKIISGIMKADKGSVISNGVIIGEDVDFLPNTGLVIETPGFIGYQSGYKNLEILASIKNVIKKERIKETMKLVGLDPESKKKVKKYSLGMRQKLGLAQAIMEDNDVYIFDEPMNSLDKETVSNIRDIIKELKEKNKIVIISSHMEEDINLLCDEVYDIVSGVVSKRG